MKGKTFAFICMLYCIFAMESENKKEIERLNKLVESLQSEVTSLKLELNQINWLNENTQNCPKKFKEKDCKICGGAIFQGQLHIKRGNCRSNAHAICQTGFHGYECSYYPKGVSTKYNSFHKKLLKLFEKSDPRFIDLTGKYIENNMELEENERKLFMGGDTERMKRLVKVIKDLNEHVAYWFDKSTGKYWAIHRNHYGKPEDVNWEQFIIEILKRKGEVPLVNYSLYYPKSGQLIVPPKLLDFIKKYTQTTCFAEALERCLHKEVEIFNCGENSFIRLRTPQMKGLPSNTYAQQNYHFKQCDSSSSNRESSHFLNNPNLWYHYTPQNFKETTKEKTDADDPFEFEFTSNKFEE